MVDWRQVESEPSFVLEAGEISSLASVSRLPCSQQIIAKNDATATVATAARATTETATNFTSYKKRQQTSLLLLPTWLSSCVAADLLERWGGAVGWKGKKELWTIRIASFRNRKTGKFSDATLPRKKIQTFDKIWKNARQLGSSDDYSRMMK